MRDSFIFTFTLTVVVPSTHCDICNSVYNSSIINNNSNNKRERRINL